MEKKSIYKYASECGVSVGLYLTLMSACVLMSIKIPALPLLLLPLILCLPIILWVNLRKIVKADPTYNKFASLWLGGIYTIIFGTLICTFLSALYIFFIEPNFVYQYVTNALTAVEMSPMASEYESTVALMREAMEAHILPSGFEFVTTMAWFTCFSGSLLSLVIALLMSYLGKKTTQQFSA